jgi:hypothetical protein
MKASDLDGKLLTLLLIGETEDGKDDWAVFPGTARVRTGSLFLERSGGKEPFAIREDWLERVKPVEPSVKDILGNADYYLPLMVGNIPDGANVDDVARTALQWPK